MTSTAPGAHPRPEEVDALLDPSGGDPRVDAHVERCEHCRYVRDGLREVRALLGRQSREVPPEPPDLGARITAALAAEPPLRAAAGGPGAPGGGAGSVDGATVTSLGQRRRRPVTTWLAVAASVAVVGLGGTFLATRVSSTTTAEAGSTSEYARSAGGRAADPGGEQDTSGASGGAVPGPDGGGADEEGQSRGGQGTSSPTARAQQGQAPGTGGELASGTEYSRARLATQAEQLLRVVDDLGPRADLDREAASGRALADRRTLGACLVALGRPGAVPVATDLARFEGQPVAVLVLARTRGHEVVVVPDTCGSGDDRVLATASLD